MRRLGQHFGQPLCKVAGKRRGRPRGWAICIHIKPFMWTAAISQIAAHRLPAVNLVSVYAAQRHHGCGFRDDHLCASRCQWYVNTKLRHQLRNLRPCCYHDGIAAISSGCSFHRRHLAACCFKACHWTMLNNFAAQVLQGPCISLYAALRVGVSAKFIMYTAKTVVARERHGFLDLFDVKHFDGMAKPVVTFGNEAILLPLPLGHGNKDASLLMLGRIAQQLVHLRPHPLFFVKQGAGVMRCTTAIASRCLPANDELVEHGDLDS